jgi:hypothetical protein
MHANEPAPVAVDSTNGHLYVVDPGHFVVDVFDGEGKYICQFSGVGRGCHVNPLVELGSSPTFGELTGVAVDANGNVYVADYTNEVVDEFTAAGADVQQIPGCEATHPASNHPSGIAIDSNEVLYVQDYFSNVVICPGGSVLDPEQSFDVAVDPSTNDVYVDHGSSIAVYGASPANTLVDTFTVGSIGSEGVAVDGTRHLVYVTDKSAGEVLVFEPVTVPDVRLTPPPTEITSTSAILHGEINPDEAGEASYYFEYGTNTNYGSTSPTPPGTSAGEGNALVPASTELTGLQPGTVYHYRLVGTNGSGLTNPSEDGTFTTANIAPVLGNIEACQVTTDSVTFCGTVNPETLPTRYHIEYGLTSAYGETLPEIGIGAGGEPAEVRQSSPANLQPGTTYHYRLLATNSTGTTPSSDQTFRTLPTATPPTTPPVLGTGPATVLGPTEASISALVFPEGLPTTWVLELGLAPGTYETRVFGSIAGEPGSASPTAIFTDLQPGTTYHYRVIASNAAGTSAGLDRAFTTPLLGPVITQPLAPPLLPLPVFPPVKEPLRPVKCHKGFVKKAGKCVRKGHPKHHPARKAKKKSHSAKMSS